ncbi:DUF4862 family protein [Humibacter antri]
MTPSAIDGYVVGAYAASPAHQRWDPQREDAYLTLLEQEPRVGALELPWSGRLHPHDSEWLLAHWPERFRAVMTDVPWAARQVTDDPAYGLASTDEEGRRRAISSALALRDDVERLADAVGRPVVQVVELHSSPRASSGCAERLALSLDELSATDWHGAQLVIEHCDALVADHEPEKGFLSLDDEIRAIRLSETDVGLSLNWGRSAIELRDAHAVADQVERAASTGLLQGLMISGASDRDGVMGSAWVDAHHPFLRSPQHPDGDPASLLTEELVAASFAAAGRLRWRGVKVGWPPNATGTVERRVAMIARALDALDRVSGGK